MTTWRIIGVMIVIPALLVCGMFLVLVDDKPANSTAVRYTFSVVNVYPHDTNAFTEGLVFENGFLYESTGLYGNSSLRRVDLETGKVLQVHTLQAQYFGEGIAIVGDEIVQLTWQSHVSFVYDKATFSLLQEFEYPTEGWGLTYDGKRLIMSDGTSNLYFLDPVTFKRIGQVAVHDTGPVTELNELEYIKGEVYANIWEQSKIAVINPQTGQVTAWIDLTGIQDSKNQYPNNVLNGIAYDTNGDRLFVTGKMWPHIFEIKLIPSA
ncbi:MAG: glutaminyl-peptide cyclotransferase [Candidatus Bathyarchaeia archaeon]|jgi:glutamine cyclotransferase